MYIGLFDDHCSNCDISQLMSKGSLYNCIIDFNFFVINSLFIFKLFRNCIYDSSLVIATGFCLVKFT